MRNLPKGRFSGGLGKPWIADCLQRQHTQCDSRERRRYIDFVADQQLASLRVAIRLSPSRQRVPVLRPQCGQYKYRTTRLIPQQLTQPRRNPLSCLVVSVEVELGLIQP